MSTLREILGNSQYWGLTLSIAAYLFACWLKQKTKLAFLNPILVSVIVIIAFLLGVGIDYDTYNKGASYLSWLLTPATVCLAIPLYKQLHLLKEAWCSCCSKHYFWRCHQCSEVFSSMCRVLGLSHTIM